MVGHALCYSLSVAGFQTWGCIRISWGAQKRLKAWLVPRDHEMRMSRGGSQASALLETTAVSPSSQAAFWNSVVMVAEWESVAGLLWCSAVWHGSQAPLFVNSVTLTSL